MLSAKLRLSISLFLPVFSLSRILKLVSSSILTTSPAFSKDSSISISETSTLFSSFCMVESISERAVISSPGDAFKADSILELAPVILS